MISLRKISIAGLLAILLLTACDKDTVYHSYLHVPNQGWGKNDTLLFTVPVQDSLALYRLSVEIRNGEKYPYSNLYLFISHNGQDSTLFVTDTIECTLANKQGQWTGTGWGGLYSTSYQLSSIITKRKGNYKFKITHGMRDDLLQGIDDIGLCITH